MRMFYIIMPSFRESRRTKTLQQAHFHVIGDSPGEPSFGESTKLQNSPKQHLKSPKTQNSPKKYLESLKKFKTLQKSTWKVSNYGLLTNNQNLTRKNSISQQKSVKKINR
jgi:oligoendopeptidase F